MNSRTYRFGPSTLTLIFGDISKSQAEVLVSSDDHMLTMSGGVSAALRRGAGEPLLIDAPKKTPARLGDVVVTTAGALPAKHIFHAITIGEGRAEIPTEEIIVRTTQRSLELLDILNLQSIAFPAIGAGAAGFSYDDVAVRMAGVITDYLASAQRALEVSIYLFHRFRRMHTLDFVKFFEEFASRARNLPSPEPTAPKETPDKSEHPPLGHINPRQQAALALSELTQERDKIEIQLAEFEGAFTEAEVRKLEQRLKEIHRLRLKTLSTLHNRSDQGIQVFISYSHKDVKYRDTLRTFLRSLERQKLVTAWYDRMITAGAEWQGQIDKHLETSGVILLLISADFIASEYCFDIELKRPMERHEAGEALVIPIVVRPAIWDDMPFARLQALPSERKPVSTWEDEDSACVDVTQGIKIAINDFMANKRA